MIEIQGALNKAVVFTDEMDQASMSQIHEMMNHPAFEGKKVRIMPDVHAGKGSVVGFTSELGPKVIANVVGVDIGCGVRLDEIPPVETDQDYFKKLDEVIRERVPCGTNVRKKVSRFLKDSHHEAGKCYKDLLPHISEVCSRTDQDLERVILSIGSLGGGNHYVEVGSNGKGSKFFSVHSGSRNFGLKVANFHQHKAIAENHKHQGFSKELSWLEGEMAQSYLRDMDVAQRMAKLSRLVMYLEVADGMGWETGGFEHIECIHNYIDLEKGYIRKGAISAQLGERVVIPISMSEGVIIGTGKGNPDWNYSAPHGAGRLMSRSKAKATLSMDEYMGSMKGIWSSCVSTSTLDEAPMAYKGMDYILGSIGPTVEVTSVVRPLYNFKA